MAGPRKHERGRYVSTFVALVDDPDFERLSSSARAVFVLGLKLAPENNIAGVFAISLDTVAHRVGVDLEVVRAALDELERERWIIREGRWLWIRNHLRYDPHFAVGNENHVAGLVRFLGTLPRIGLVRRYVEYYQAARYLPSTQRLLQLAPWVASLPLPAQFGADASTSGSAQALAPNSAPANAGGDPLPEPIGDGIPHPLPDPVAVSVAVGRSRNRNQETRSMKSHHGGGKGGDGGTGAHGDPPLDAAVSVVWSTWLKVMRPSHPDDTVVTEAQLTAKRRKAIETALREGSKVAELKLAIEGCLASDYHMGRTAKKTGVDNDVTRIVKDRDTVEEFIRILREAWPWVRTWAQDAGLGEIESLGDLDQPSAPFWYRIRVNEKRKRGESVSRL